MNEILLDSFIDSLKVFGLAFAFFFVFSFLENQLQSFLGKSNKAGPIVGAITGVVPQCAIPILGSDLYLSNQISAGTLIAIFIASSDEALPILFSDFSGKWYMGFALIAAKVVFAFLSGSLFDIAFTRFLAQKKRDDMSFPNDQFRHLEEETKIHRYLLHPLFHSLKIFVYAFIVTFLFHLLILSIGGESVLSSFLANHYYLSPLYSVLIGLIPNCASSVVLSETYLEGFLPFGALLAGLSVNAGLGPLYLLKSKKNFKDFLFIEGSSLVLSIGIGYLFLLFPLP